MLYVLKGLKDLTSMNVCVDTVFCPPSICVSNPKISKNIILFPWGHENIQNDAA